MTGAPQIGHNGGPRLPLARKLTPAQDRALRMIRDHGDAFRGLAGRSRIGGSNNTRWWLQKEGLAAIDFSHDVPDVLTERGARVLAAGRMVD